MNMIPSTPPVKAQTKHIVLFVIACVLLAGTLLCLYGFADLAMISDEPIVDAQLPGGEFFLGLMLLLAGYAVVSGFAVCWGGGQVISALLAMDKGNKPRWLWVASLALTIVNVICLAFMLGIWIWA